VLEQVAPGFAQRARQQGGGFVVAGANYGQGSSREHAALGPLHLGVRAVLARSFARIHRANLVNFGILPLVLPEGAAPAAGDELRLPGVREALAQGKPVVVENLTQGTRGEARHDLSGRQVEIVLAGGLLRYMAETR